jgi:hypothetical protein
MIINVLRVLGMAKDSTRVGNRIVLIFVLRFESWRRTNFDEQLESEVFEEVVLGLDPSHGRSKLISE